MINDNQRFAVYIRMPDGTCRDRFEGAGQTCYEETIAFANKVATIYKGATIEQRLFKSKQGRPSPYSEKTTTLIRRVPASKYDELATIVDNKLKEWIK